jgi:hypothetical protein
VSVIARRTVEGIMEAATESRSNLLEVVKHVVKGAIQGGGEIGTVAVGAMKKVLGEVAGGLNEIAIAIAPKSRAARSTAASKRAPRARKQLHAA